MVSLVGLSSCKKENQNGVTFTATMEDCADVHNAKTVLNGTVLQWVAGDEIIINSVNFTATPLNDPTMATFTTTDANFSAANETYLAFYPAENSNNNYVGLPTTQESVDGSLRGFPMHAYSEGSTNLQFRNLCGVLKLVLQKPGVTVTSIALTMDQKINGIYDVDNPTSAGATLSSIPIFNAGGNTTTLVCNQSINTPHDFYIYLPAGTYTGLKLVITTADGRVCTKGPAPATHSVVIERSKYSTLTLGGNDLTFIRPTGTKGGFFTINENGNQVWFSQGNQQYQCSTHVWSFALNQYDYVGDGNSNISEGYPGWIDLFGWGTGESPTCGVTDWQNYRSYNEWGNNRIRNGGNTANSGWRTLSSAEWNYLFNTRANSTNLGTVNARYAKGMVNNKHGVILFPDGYTHPTGITIPTGINATGSTGWNSNSYTLNEWVTMEAAGAVFLPAAGYRWGSDVLSVGTNGVYWSSTHDHEYDAYGMFFASGYLDATGEDNRYYGYAVRLVKDYN